MRMYEKQPDNTFEAPNDYRSYLCHYGVKGMKWGIRHDKPSAGKKRNKFDFSKVDNIINDTKALYNRRKDVKNELSEDGWKESIVSGDDTLIFVKNTKTNDGREAVLSMTAINTKEIKSDINKLKRDLSSILNNSSSLHKDFVRIVAEEETKSGYGRQEVSNMVKEFNSSNCQIYYDGYTNNKSNKYEYSMTMWHDDFGFVKFLTYNAKSKKWEIDDVPVSYV